MKSKKLNLKETQYAIEKLKDYFSHNLRRKLNLVRVSAPLFVRSKSGLNDGLNGEGPVVFKAKGINENLEVVHSLAKWKRDALARYNFDVYEGLYTDMNAIRREEDLDKNHSFYVDQWDWELVIHESDRNLKFLKRIVKKIYSTLKATENRINKIYPNLSKKLPRNIEFINSLDLYNQYPKLTPEQREYEAVKKYGAIFVYGIGYDLPDGKPHSKRAKDYDDWELNGDMVVYDKVNDQALEISSMGIRVNKNSIQKQYNLSAEEISLISPYHKRLINKELPFTIGGGLGQSRIAMFLLEKKHIGEVQVSVWDEKNLDDAFQKEITIL
ncbi:aspartate--ammonia ligase [Metamycoplasma neophronis]|uniref:Aspartate--ammonia ligase n=1 Tax=Metamycoplasma neophronis TaxID=872983 RepID=A0ABY2YZX1_9BACT|nr:aspartate--ammonia ligase [Metamycoplasma neophronis]TPR53704.1 aspartate--ammonia ligase [Metamycoplasma neophronis]